MSTFFTILFFAVLLSIPVQFVIFLIRAIRRKRKWINLLVLGVCVASIVPLFFMIFLTDPAVWCNHEREFVSETYSTCTVQGEIIEYCSECDINVTTYKKKLPHDYQLSETIKATCQQKGKIIYKCSQCNGDKIEKTEKIDHDYQWSKTVDATCTNIGYVENKCTMCSSTQRTNIDALGHSMKEISRTEPTREVEGKIVYHCERCGHEEVESIDKLPPLTYIEGVDFEEIYRAYKANELRADDIYKNNRYRITAQVNGISSGGILNLTGGATLTMMIKVDNTYVFFLAEFEKEQEDNLKTISVGDTITFEGECLSAGSWSNCELIIE